MQALFYPDFPELELYTIVAVFNRLDYFATTDPQAEFDFAVAWQDHTWCPPQPLLERIAAERIVINHHCNDISKQYVERIASQVFGYTTLVDPRSYDGRCVKKPNENARARGSIIHCPDSTHDPDYVYQVYIDTRDELGLRNEYRVPIVFGHAPCVYLQRKPHHEQQAKTVPLSTSLLATNEVFSSSEQRQIASFCSKIGLDFGDLDILRDRQTGKLFIIDANKTGGGFGLLNRFRWTVADRRKAIDLIATAFAEGIRQRQ